MLNPSTEYQFQQLEARIVKIEERLNGIAPLRERTETGKRPKGWYDDIFNKMLGQLPVNSGCTIPGETEQEVKLMSAAVHRWAESRGKKFKTMVGGTVISVLRVE